MQLLKALFVLVTCFAAGLVTSGVVAGAGPLAALSTTTETTGTETTETETTTEEDTTTDEESTDGETTDTAPTDTTETETTEPSVSGDPTIVTGKDDYVPTEYVDIYGTGWMPNETVELFVDDHEGKSWNHTATVTADEQGAFEYFFRLPEHFVASYSVLASGDVSGEAEWMFSDSIAQGAASSNSNSGGSGAPAQRLTLSVPAIPAGGTAVAQIVVHKDLGSGQICPPSGWTSIERTDRSSGVYVQQTFQKAGAAAAASEEWTFRASCPSGSLIAKGASGGVVVFTGVDTASPIRDVDEATGTSSGNPTAPSSTAVVGDMVLRLFGHEKNSALTSSSGTEIWDLGATNVSSRRAAGYTASHASGSSTGTFGVTTGDSGEWTAQTIVLRMATPVSDAPVVSSPICAGATSVSGTSTEANGTTVEVFKNDASVGAPHATVTSNAWTKTGLAALVAGDQIKARATATGETVSPDSNTVTVVACNTAPTAVDDTYGTNEDTDLTLDAVVAGPNASPVDNDLDSEANTLTVTSVSGAAHGTVGLSAGTITFSPDDDYCGTGASAGGFDYVVSDGSLTDSGHVTVNITCVNDAPTCEDVSIATDEDTQGSEAADCTDVDGDTLTYVAGPAATGISGVSGGDLTYDPDGQFEALDDGATGNDSFTYVANDGTVDSAPADVSVTINGANDAPECAAVTISVSEDGPASTTAPDCTDVEGDTLTYNAGAASGAGLSGFATGNLTYDPNGQFESLDDTETANDSFTYTANDGDATSAPANVGVTINGANDAPTCQDASITTNENTLGSTPADCADVDVEPLTYAANPASGAGVSGVSGNDLTYDPNGQFEGLDTGETASDSFTYTANDGTAASNAASVAVTITGVNDAPVCEDVTIAVSEDGPAGSTATDCTDVDDEPLTYTVTQPTKGVSSLTAGQLAFDPNGDFEGLDTGESDTTDGDFTYTANDATVDSSAAAVGVTVNGANDAPVCQAASITTDEDTLGSTPADCTDVDVEPLTYTANPATTGVSGVSGNDLTYDPNGQFEHLGTGDTANDSFTYTANDGAVDSAPATVSVTITGVNDAPVVVLSGAATANEGDTKTYVIDTTDPDSSLFSLDARACGASGAVDPTSVDFDTATGDGSFDCVFADDNPTGTAADTSIVTVTVSDDEPVSDGDTLDVTVSNLAPNVTIVSPTAGTYPVGVPIAVNATFTDAGKPDTHTCTINGGPGTVTYTPPGSGTGTCTGSVTPTAGAFTVTVTVSDDDLGATTKSVALNALYSIYAHERCSGGSGKGVIVNGASADIDGAIHSNGNFTINGPSFESGTASLYRPQSGCSTSYSPSRVNFGPPSPTAPVNVPLQSWPWSPAPSAFPCTFPIKDEYVFNSSNVTIPSGVYCARKSFKINGSNVTGNITVLAPEIVLNGRNINLSWHTGGMLLFAINPQTGALSSKEIVVNGELSVGAGAALTGVVHNPGGGVKVNGTVRLHRGFIQGLWVEMNGQGFRMTY